MRGSGDDLPAAISASSVRARRVLLKFCVRLLSPHRHSGRSPTPPTTALPRGAVRFAECFFIAAQAVAGRLHIARRGNNGDAGMALVGHVAHAFMRAVLVVEPDGVRLYAGNGAIGRDECDAGVDRAFEM